MNPSNENEPPAATTTTTTTTTTATIGCSCSVGKRDGIGSNKNDIINNNDDDDYHPSATRPGALPLGPVGWSGPPVETR